MFDQPLDKRLRIGSAEHQELLCMWAKNEYFKAIPTLLISGCPSVKRYALPIPPFTQAEAFAVAVKRA